MMKSLICGDAWGASKTKSQALPRIISSTVDTQTMLQKKMREYLSLSPGSKETVAPQSQRVKEMHYK